MTPTRSTTRSPAAPSRSLATCYGIALKIYNSFQHIDFGGPEVAGSANLSASGSQAKGLISDLKQYGLIEKTKAGRFQVSQEFKNAVAQGEGSSGFKAAMWGLAQRPPVFQAILSDARGTLPDEAALAANLRSAQRFNLEKAQATAKALSESLEWTGVLDAKRNIIQPRIKSSGTDTTLTQDDDTALQEEDALDDQAGSKAVLALDIPLSDGRTARIRYPHDLTATEATKIGKVLAAICD